MPEIEPLCRKTDAIELALADLQQIAILALDQFVADEVEPLKAQTWGTLSVPCANDGFKSFLEELVRRLEALHINQQAP